MSKHTLAYDKYNTYTATTTQKYAWPEYAQDGLIHMWDAILNTGKDTHKDGDIPYWKDVVGSTDLIITSTNVYFTSNSFYLPVDRESGIARSSGSIYDESSYVTVEVCASDNAGLYFPFDKDNAMTIFNSSARMQSSSSDSTWYSPFFIAADGYLRGWEGDGVGYKMILAKSYNGNIRMMGFNLADSAKYIKGQYTISFENESRDYMTTTEWYQPYHTSIATVHNFGSSIARYNMTTNAVKRYNATGKLRNAFGLYAYDYLTIGGLAGKKAGQSYPWSGGIYECSHWNGEIYCVRIYNRKLTMEEKLANYEIDYRRFFDASKVTH